MKKERGTRKSLGTIRKCVDSTWCAFALTICSSTHAVIWVRFIFNFSLHWLAVKPYFQLINGIIGVAMVFVSRIVNCLVARLAGFSGTVPLPEGGSTP